MIGRIFGRWEVISAAPSAGQGTVWNCRCVCGSERVVRAAKLRSGKSTSCGCFRKELRTTHGLHGHPLYATWAGMIARCQNPKHNSFERYGGRGIMVCAEWNEPSAFIAWAIDNGWTPGLQLDRRENDQGYSPSNCRFVTPDENANNRSSCHIILIGDDRFTVTQAARKFGVNRETIYGRLNRGVPAHLAVVPV